MNVSRTRDFPDWLGPMLIKELRQGLKARAFELSFIALQVVLALVISWHALLYAKNGDKFESDGLTAIFWVIVCAQLLVATPLRALAGLASERKANTLELIFMTGLSSWRIAWGKWGSLVFQSVLFVLAVLPYAFLRYFFGGVNLIEDLTAITWALLASAVLSAIGLAISGLKPFVRIGVIILVVLFGTSFIPALLVGLFVRAARTSFGGISFDLSWPITLLDAVLITLGALELAAASIAPVAENHALRQRLLALCVLIPLPLLKLTHADESLQIAQLVFSSAVLLGLSWVHLSAPSPSLRVHLEPFARRGPAGFFLGAFFQPGWHGAVAFLALSEALLFFSARWIVTSANPDDLLQFQTVVLMIGASLLTAPLIWRVIRRRAKFPFVEHSLFLVLCGGIAAVANLMTRSPAHLGEVLGYGLIPPVGFWAMLDRGLDAPELTSWAALAFAMFTVLTLASVGMATPYWRNMRILANEIRKSRPEPQAVAPVAVA